jgi:hypothetical protein
MLLFEFAFAPALVFGWVLLQAANAMLNNTISDNKQAFLLIFFLLLSKYQKPGRQRFAYSKMVKHRARARASDSPKN